MPSVESKSKFTAFWNEHISCAEATKNVANQNSNVIKARLFFFEKRMEPRSDLVPSMAEHVDQKKSDSS